MVFLALVFAAAVLTPPSIAQTTDSAPAKASKPSGRKARKAAPKQRKPSVGKGHKSVTRKRSRRATPPAWSFGGSFGIAYDDNVFEYTQRDMEAFRSGDNPERFGIESIDDFVFTTELEATRRLSSTRAARSYLDLETRSRLYLHNSMANDLRLRMSLRREERDSSTRLRFTYLPDSYLRRLWDRESREYLPAEYDDTALGLRYRKDVAPKWLVDGEVSWSYRDYVTAFDERDSGKWAVGLTAHFRPNRSWDAWAGYERGWSRARATDPDPDVDVDTSYDEDVYSLGCRYLDGGRNRWSFEWQRENQTYTTSLTPTDDPYHSGRRDSTNSYSLGYRRIIDRDHWVELEWDHERQSTHLSADAAVDGGSEALDYHQNVYSVRYGVNF